MYNLGKRNREEEEEEVTISPSGEKKLRTLPFRTSPTTQHTSFFSRSRSIPKPPALTPAESSEDESDIELASPKCQIRRKTKPTVPAFFASGDDSMDLDMEDSQPFHSPVWSPKTPATAGMALSSTFASPAYSHLLSSTRSPVNQTSRLPTPIYGHFSNLHNPIQDSRSPTAARPSVVGVARSSVAEQHDAYLRKRRLPSPISEDENMESPTVVTKGMFKELSMCATPASATFPPTFPENDMITPDSADFPNRKENGSPNMSRRRSDAISSPADERKVVFSMGYRADCEKCRERVPGHYSHVLRV